MRGKITVEFRRKAWVILYAGGDPATEKFHQGDRLTGVTRCYVIDQPAMFVEYFDIATKDGCYSEIPWAAVKIVEE